MVYFTFYTASQLFFRNWGCICGGFCAQGVGAEERYAGGHVRIHISETDRGSRDTGPPAAPPERGGLLHWPAAREGERERKGRECDHVIKSVSL